MSMHFAKLQKKYKEVVKENADLKTQAAQHETEKARVAHEHVQAAIAPIQQKNEELRDALQALEAQLAAASGSLTETTSLKDSLTDHVSMLTASRDGWKAKCEAQATSLAAAEQAVEDLKAAHAQQLADLKAAYEQIARNATNRERERLAAIENRKALTNAVPARNRG